MVATMAETASRRSPVGGSRIRRPWAGVDAGTDGAAARGVAHLRPGVRVPGAGGVSVPGRDVLPEAVPRFGVVLRLGPNDWGPDSEGRFLGLRVDSVYPEFTRFWPGWVLLGGRGATVMPGVPTREVYDWWLVYVRIEAIPEEKRAGYSAPAEPVTNTPRPE